MQKLAKREEQIMQAMWQLGQVTVLCLLLKHTTWDLSAEKTTFHSAAHLPTISSAHCR